MNSDVLNVHDDDLSTAGGPPAWFAFAVVSATYFAVVVGALAYCVFVPF